MKPSMCPIKLLSVLWRTRLLSRVRQFMLITFVSACVAIPAHYVASPPAAQAIGGHPSKTIVISQVYGGGGNVGAPYTNDFIELYNRSTTPVSLSGWSVQYTSNTGTAWQVTLLTPVTLQPGQYYLIQESSGGANGAPLPTPDVSDTIAMNATAGKVALINCTTALSGACPSNITGTCSIIDFVGYGTTANCSETANAPPPSNTTAIIRGGGGNTETDNNSSDFTPGAPTPRNTGSPFNIATAVRLDSLSAKRYRDGSVVVEWQTGFEADNLGFNIYREQDGQRALITPQLIAGSALTSGLHTQLAAGQSYSWIDSPPLTRADAVYWLEEMDLNGASFWHGPVRAARAREDAPPSKGRMSLLGELGKDRAGELETGGPQDNNTRCFARTALLNSVTPAQVEAQSDIAGRAAIKLSVKQEGYYRVTQPELLAAGLDASVDPRNLQLFADGRQQPIRVTGEGDGRFDVSDAIEFYGVGIDSAVTGTRTYWLVTGAQAGRRIAIIKDEGGRAVAGSFPYTVERRDRSVYFSSLLNGDRENFFGAVVSKAPVELVLTLKHLDTSSPTDSTLELALQGVTALPHRVRVELNGIGVGDLSFTNQDQGVGRFTLTRGALKEGDNTLRLTGLNSADGLADVSIVDYIRVTYPHAYLADGDALRFPLSKKQRVSIGGFTSDAIRVLDVTDLENVIEVRARVDSPDRVHFATALASKLEGERNLWAFTEAHIKRPDRVAPNRPSDLRQSSREADFIIIAHKEFIESVRPLESLRRGEGLAVAVVDVEDVFDEFSFGNKSPQAIKDFLQFAKANWAKPPRFALLVGDASLDPKDYLGRGDNDFVPTKMIDTSSMETASDDWLADFDGDGLADIALGRLPARDSREASLMVSKITSYSAAREGGVLLVSDDDAALGFRESSAELRKLIPEGVSVEEINRGLSSDDATRIQLIDLINRGQRIVNYQGHGSTGLWRGRLLTSEDALGLRNGPQQAIFFAMTCLNGYFEQVGPDGLAESLLKAESGGAVAVWASSGMCDAAPQAQLDAEMFRLVFDPSGGPVTIGEAVLRSKAAVKDTDVRRTYVLLGDPTMRLR